MKRLKTTLDYIHACFKCTSNGNDLIVVDIQPAYEKGFTFDIGDFIDYLDTYSGNVLYLYVGESLGFDDNIPQWLMEKAVEHFDYDEEKFESFYAKINRFEYFDKGYAFFRDLMDEGYSDDVIPIVKEMIEQDVNDARDLNFDVLRGKELVEEELIEKLEEGLFFVGIPDLIDIVRGWGNTTVVGGGQHECLAEVLLLLDIIGESYTLNHRFIY